MPVNKKYKWRPKNFPGYEKFKPEIWQEHEIPPQYISFVEGLSDLISKHCDGDLNIAMNFIRGALSGMFLRSCDGEVWDQIEFCEYYGQTIILQLMQDQSLSILKKDSGE